jgi:hypothetical protein
MEKTQSKSLYCALEGHLLLLSTIVRVLEKNRQLLSIQRVSYTPPPAGTVIFTGFPVLPLPGVEEMEVFQSGSGSGSFEKWKLWEH